jgi:bla regulator protein blaR1
MIAYLLKSFIFSGLFLLAYYLFLQKEKTHRFNRFYLLFALLFSITAPLLSIQTYSSTLAPVADNYILIEQNISKAGALTKPMKDTASPFAFLPVLYGSISLFVFFRLLYILYGFQRLVRKNPVIRAAGTKLVLLARPVSPHTFLHYIFLSKEAYYHQAIEPDIIDHESAHVRQKHSLDILVVELIQVFMWINPLLFFYRRAIQLNHEYLADDAVIRQKEDISTYQYLLLNKATHKATAFLPSHFNFLIIKKRLTMMTKTTSRKKALLLQWTIAPVITALALSFCIETLAQEKAAKSNPKIQIKEHTQDGASPELMKEFDDILKKHRYVSPKGFVAYKEFLKEERDRLETIFKTMNREQQSKSMVRFAPWQKPYPKRIPTAQQLDDFSNPNKYGVRIDGYQRSNEILKKYQPSDFSHFSAYRLYGAARKSPRQNYQVDLMTNKHYNRWLESAKKDTLNIMMIKIVKASESPVQTP